MVLVRENKIKVILNQKNSFKYFGLLEERMLLNMNYQEFYLMEYEVNRTTTLREII